MKRGHRVPHRPPQGVDVGALQRGRDRAQVGPSDGTHGFVRKHSGSDGRSPIPRRASLEERCSVPPCAQPAACASCDPHARAPRTPPRPPFSQGLRLENAGLSRSASSSDRPGGRACRGCQAGRASEIENRGIHHGILFSDVRAMRCVHLQTRRSEALNAHRRTAHVSAPGTVRCPATPGRAVRAAHQATCGVLTPRASIANACGPPQRACALRLPKSVRWRGGAACCSLHRSTAFSRSRSARTLCACGLQPSDEP
jgi:hypothetical protein